MEGERRVISNIPKGGLHIPSNYARKRTSTSACELGESASWHCMGGGRGNNGNNQLYAKWSIPGPPNSTIQQNIPSEGYCFVAQFGEISGTPLSPRADDTL